MSCDVGEVIEPPTVLGLIQICYEIGHNVINFVGMYANLICKPL